MMLQIDARKIQVALAVMQRAPVTVAEQIVCEEVAALLIQLAEGQAQSAQPLQAAQTHRACDASGEGRLTGDLETPDRITACPSPAPHR